MSIIILKKALFSLRLVKLATFTFIFFLAVSLIPHFAVTAKAECYAISGSCSVLGNKYYPLADPSQCTLEDTAKGYVPQNTICCCTEKENSNPTKPKYILILSVTAFFAILTALVYFYKKNE